VAAPVFREIVQQTLSHLAISPSVSQEKILMAEPVVPVSPKSVVSPGVSQVLPGQMPDFTGFTMKEVLEALQNYSLEVKFVGSGVVIDQTPKPATPVTEANDCILVFGKPVTTNLSGKDI
jgi:cell division protein FtsI (penicillin-binding protein 3)